MEAIGVAKKKHNDASVGFQIRNEVSNGLMPTLPTMFRNMAEPER
jgi:hypothetical protein